MFNGAELNYFMTEKELLSTVHCLKEFHMYCLKEFHKALSFIKRCHINNSRITRWILVSPEYNFQMMYCKEMDNSVTNVLSQYPEDLEHHQPISSNDKSIINTCRIQISRDVKNDLKCIRQYQQADQKM